MSDHFAALRQVFADYNTLRKPVPANWPELKLVAVSTKTGSTGADETCFGEVVEALNEEEQSGWVRFQSDVYWTGAGYSPDFAECGPPLFAEWTTGAQASCRLRADPDTPGKVHIWTYTERDLGVSDDLRKDETAFLRETVTVLGHRKRLGSTELVYHIYWAAPEKAAPEKKDPFALRRVFDRFAGFKMKEGK